MMTERQRRRRGIVILLVLSLLVLFVLLAVTFAIVAGQYRRAAEAYAREELIGEPPRVLADRTVYQLLRDTYYSSSIRSHSLLSDLYGNDGVTGTVRSAQWQAGGQLIRVEFTFDSAFDPTQPQNAVLRRPDRFNGCVFTILARLWPGPDGGWGVSGTGTPSDDDDGDGNTDEADEAGWPGSDDFRALSDSTRVVDYDYNATLNRGMVMVEALHSDRADYLLPAAGQRFVINGRPFNGAGAGFVPYGGAAADNSAANTLLACLNSGADGGWGVATVDDDGDGNTDEADEAGWPGSDDIGPLALLPHLAGYTTLPSAPVNQGGLDESYDAVDFQNMFLAAVAPDLSVIIPSFHRPALVNYWANRAGSSGGTPFRFWGLLQNPNAVPADWTHAPSGISPSDPHASYRDFRRMVVFRPMPWDHPDFSGSNPALDPKLRSAAQIQNALINGPWDVDNDGDGVPDSIWIDVGFRVVTAPDGRRYKPLVAILCEDLDGRLDVNAHGSYAQLNTQRYGPGVEVPFDPDPSTAPDIVEAFAGGVPRRLTGLSRGSGYGPADVFMGHIFHGNYGNVLASRYLDGGAGSVFAAGLDADPLAYAKQVQVPNNFANEFSGYSTPPDLWGRGAMALDYLGQPVSYYMGLPNEKRDNPYQLRANDYRAGRVDNPFGEVDLERILRWNDVDAPTLSSRLLSVSGNTFTDSVNRHVVTTRTSHLPVANLTIPPDLYGDLIANLANPAVVGRDRSLSILDLYRARLNKGGLSGPNLETQLRIVAPFEFFHGEMFNVNRLWGNGVDDNQNLIVDEPLEGDRMDNDSDGTIDELDEFEPDGVDDDGANGPDDPAELAAGNVDTEKIWSGTGSYLDNAFVFHHNGDPMAPTLHPRRARQIYARHLYCLMMLLTNAPSGDDAYAQRVAQWAINVVDFRDPDSIMTPFEYDKDPFNASGWQTNIDGDPTTDEGGDRALVWGCERPELLITETLAFHDRRTEDLDNEQPNGGEVAAKTTDAMNPDADFDQRLRPRSGFFVEVYNPWSGNHRLPAEFYCDHSTWPAQPVNPATALTDGVLLNKVSPGGSPVWRLAVVDPNDPTTIERSVYFVDPTTLTTGNNGQRYWTSLPVARLQQGRYAVIGSAGKVIPNNNGKHSTLVGRHVDADESLPDLKELETRRIELAPNGNPLVHQVAVVRNRNGEPTTPEIAPAIAVAVDRPRSLSISEPPGGYPAAGWDPTLAGGDGAYSPPIDTPLDTDPILMSNQTTGNYRRVMLQRLANPLDTWNSKGNPYITIDSASVDVTAFNGVESDSAVTGAARFRFATAQRGSFGPSPGSTNDRPTHFRALWQHEGNTPGLPPATDQTQEPPDPNLGYIIHRFPYELDHTLGFLNKGYLNINVPDTNPVPRFPPVARYTGNAVNPAPAPKYIGAPDSSHRFPQPPNPVDPTTVSYADANLAIDPPFAWLAWNDRPYHSAQELLLVPRSSAPDLLVKDYDLASTTNENYGNPNARFNYLMNFFHSGSKYFRIFDFVETPTPFVGAERWYNPNYFVSLANPATLRPPFNRFSRFRDQGRVNINTIFDARVWEGITKGFPALDPAVSGFWPQIQQSRRGYNSGQPYGFHANYPTRFANPFRSSAGAHLVPLRNMWIDLDGDGEFDGAQATLLRSHPLGTNAPPLFGYVSPQHYNNTNRNPYFRYQGVARLGNLLTTHSNVFAVWVTIGYFEVDGAGRLGQEVGIETGEVERHRAFYLIDRSVPVGFQVGENHNVDRCILLRRFIE